jgi:hypothetical protein
VDAADVAVLVAVVVAGPWGVVLIVALIRGYDLRVLLTRRHHRDDDDDAA